MSIIEKARSFLQNDPLIHRVLRNSGYLFSSSTISSALGFLQGILVVRLLGDVGFGLLVVIMDFPSAFLPHERGDGQIRGRSAGAKR